MKRDLLPAFVALTLTTLALPSAGWADLPLVPAAPGPLLVLFGVLTLLLALTAVLRGPIGVLSVLATATPFVLYAAWAQPSHAALVHAPSTAWLLALGGLFAVSWVRPRYRARAVAGITLLLLLATVLPVTGWGQALGAVNPATHPTSRTQAERVLAPPREGLRRGGPVRVASHPLATPDNRGPRFARANAVDLPRRAPLAVVFDGAAEGGHLTTEPTFTLVHASTVVSRLPRGTLLDAMDLDVFDAAVVSADAWRDGQGPAVRANVEALASFVRRGGLLIGPPVSAGWPPLLARRLGEAGRGTQHGVRGVRRFGLGHVLRTRSTREIRDALSTELWVREARTVFDRAQVSPRPPPELATFAGSSAASAARAGRRDAVLLFVGFTALLFVFGFTLRGAMSRAAAGIPLVVAAVLVLAWFLPRHPGFVAEGVLIEMGGTGGRAVEAVRIDAGPAGFAGHVAFERPGAFRVLGGGLDARGRVVVAPGTGAWVVREGRAVGRLSGETDDRFVGWIRPLLAGQIDPKRLRYGRIPALAVQIPGNRPVSAVTVRYTGAN